jgi:hypothetical protein
LQQVLAGRPAGDGLSCLAKTRKRSKKKHKETKKLQCPDPLLFAISYEWMKFPHHMDENIIHMDEIDKMDRN